MSSKITSSDERSDDNKKSNQCISRFFQSEQDDHRNTIKGGAAKRSRTKEENTTVVQDDDDLDSDVDDIDDDNFDVDVSPVVIGTTEKMKVKQQKTEYDDIYNNNNNTGKDNSSVDTHTNTTNDNGMIMPKTLCEKDNANRSVDDKCNGVIEIGKDDNKDDDNKNNDDDDNDDSSIAVLEEQSGKVAAISNSNFKDNKYYNKNAATEEDPLLVQSCNSIASKNETIIEMVDTTTTTTTTMNQKEELESELVVSSPSTNNNNKKGNPFAKFAFAGDGADVASTAPIIGLKERRFFKSFSDTNKRTNINNDNIDDRHPKKKKKMSKVSKELLKLKDVPSDEQDTIVRKWHSMADPSASLENRRYQILLAARLHARCQEPTVRKAMAVLRDLVKPEELSVNEVMKFDPEVLANHITNVQYYNAKATQIVKAAHEIKSQHGGLVPEGEFSLLQITGIGKTFADLLSFVNTREAHENFK